MFLYFNPEKKLVLKKTALQLRYETNEHSSRWNISINIFRWYLRSLIAINANV